MRIRLDIDEKEIEPVVNATAALAEPIPDAVNADAGASNATAGIPAEDTGGPPAWLLEIVGSAPQTSASMTSMAEGDFEDAGAGPT